MNTKVSLENELVNNLQELTTAEQDELRVVSSVYIDEYEKLKTEKIKSFENNLYEQIRFYGKNPDLYQKQINGFLKKYEAMLDLLIKEYNTRFIAVNNELQDTQNNQKIAIVNIKFSITFNDEIKRKASESKKDNYEIVMQECVRQLSSCKDEMIGKINEIFYNKDKQLSTGKQSIFEKMKNRFFGKQKIENFVIQPVEIELVRLEDTINNELTNINEETVMNIAVIKDARMQTQKIFNNMLKGQGDYGE